jgi:Polycystin cation channel
MSRANFFPDCLLYFRSSWTYRDSKQLQTSSYWGQVDTYSGGGFAVDLKDNQEDSTPILQELYDNLWIDRATRAVFIDFTLYNPNINLFCVIK